MRTFILALLIGATFTCANRIVAAEVVVRDNASLRESLRNLAAGTTIKIAPGVYSGGQYVRDIDRLTIEALDPKDPPHFQGGTTAWQFSRCNQLTVRHLRISGQSSNGLNLDDGGIQDRPVSSITLEHLSVSDVGPSGNCDAIKCSGIVQLTIRDCSITGWGGEGIDLVGCHESLITGCRFVGKPGFTTATGVQTKGGSSSITIENCEFRDAGQRPLNIGGSTSLSLFRPKNAKYEAKAIVVRNNIIEGSPCAAAFVGVDGAEFTGNKVRFPEKWILRFLQETRAEGFSPCRDVLIKDNAFLFRRSDVSIEINIGEGTDPQSYRFESNHWLAEDRPEASQPRLPTQEVKGHYGSLSTDRVSEDRQLDNQTDQSVGSVRGTVKYIPDPKRPWRLGRYYIRSPKTGEIAEAVVALSKRGLKGNDTGREPATAVVDQKDFQFKPETTAIRAGDHVRFLNSDNHAHNVKTSHADFSFNVTMPVGSEHVETFKSASGITQPYRIDCVFHSAMQAWIFVFDHPWYQVTGADGAFQLNNVPPGEYQLDVAHPAGDLRIRQSIQVIAGEVLNVEIQLIPSEKKP